MDRARGDETVLLPVVAAPATPNDGRPVGDSSARRTDLGAALRTLREAVDEARFPLEQGEAEAARRAARELRAQLDDYLVPRADRLDGPLLAVVGGSTGAGKSTLVNSLVRAPVSRSGVLRPTTKGPVLVCHPQDGTWFGEQRLLPGLARSSEPGDGVLHIVSSAVLPQGLALLDAPDIDSVVARNRELARELLGTADLWLFVTTAARYADEVPWRVLRGARDRGTVVAVVLDRVPAAVRDDVTADLFRLLSEQGLPSAPLFAVNESTLDSQGLLPADQVEPLEAYLAHVAAAERRHSVARRSLLGAVAAAAATADDLAFAAVQQCAAADALSATVREAYRRAAAETARRLTDGSLLRGGLYGQWRDAVASGEVQRALRAVQEPARTRPAPSAPGRLLLAAAGTAISALLVEAETAAVEEIADRWQVDAGGRELLGVETDVDADNGAVAARDLVREWQAWLREQLPAVRTQTPRGTTIAAGLLLATVAALAPPEGDVAGGGGPSEALRRVLADAATASLATVAREELATRVSEHFTNRSRRWLHRVAALGIDPELAPRLRQAATDVSVARQLVLGLPRAA